MSSKSAVLPSFSAPSYSPRNPFDSTLLTPAYSFTVRWPKESASSMVSVMIENISPPETVLTTALQGDSLSAWVEFIREFMKANGKYFSKPYTVEQLQKLSLQSTHHFQPFTAMKNIPLIVSFTPTMIHIIEGKLHFVWSITWTPMQIELEPSSIMPPSRSSMPPSRSSTSATSAMPPSRSSTSAMPPSRSSTSATSAMPPSRSSTSATSAMPPSRSSTSAMSATSAMPPSRSSTSAMSAMLSKKHTPEIEEVDADLLPMDQTATGIESFGADPAHVAARQRVKEARLKAKLAAYKAEHMIQTYYHRYGDDLSDSESEWGTESEKEDEEDEEDEDEDITVQL